MKEQIIAKILVSAAAAVVVVAISANLLMALDGTEAAPPADSALSYPSPVVSSFAFDSSAGPYASTGSLTAAQQAPVPAGSNPVFALEIEAEGQVSVRADRATGGTSMARVDAGGDLFPQGRSLPPAEKVAAFLQRHGAVFGIDDAASELRMIGISQDQYGSTHLRYQQIYGDVPVFGAEIRGHVSEDGRLTAVNGKFVPDIDVPTSPVIPASEAARTAAARVASQQPSTRKNVDLDADASSLFVYRTFLSRGTPGTNHLAYQVEVTFGTSVREFVFVDAIEGKVVDQITGIHGIKDRRVYQSTYDPNNPDGPPADTGNPPAWQEGDLRPAANPTIEDQVAGAGNSYNLFFNLSGGTYRSWDGNDARMVTVNTDPTIVCPNANWNGTSTNYCEGTSADDVITHEWAHAYTQETSGLIYAWQSGALNESYSDIFGETVDLINNRESLSGIDTATLGNTGPRSQDENVCPDFQKEVPTFEDSSIRWLMGEDAAAFAPLPPVGDAAIRDMWNPQCAGGDLFFGDAGHVNSPRYHCSTSDGGGVHSNSSINNRAYALIVDGNTVELDDEGNPFPNPISVQGIGLTKAAHIFWRANSLYNGPATNFAENADNLVLACEDLIGQPLNRLVTSAEDGQSPVPGHAGENDDTVDPPTNEFFDGIDILDGRNVGATITQSDCDQVENAIQAVQMRFDVTKMCGFKPMLEAAPAPRCNTAEVIPNFAEGFDGGSLPAGWSTAGVSVNASTKDTANWFVTTDLPAGRMGSAAFQENVRSYGNCSTDDESGNQWLESPDITIAEPSFLLFEHYFNSEINYDGGNVKISINGGDWEVIPASAFVHNPYNGSLASAGDQNTNTLAGEEAWHGGNAGDVRGSWGESQIDLSAAGVAAGDTIRLRWDFGQDGCNGSDEGWYVDSMEVFSCGDVIEPPTEQCNVYPAEGFLPVIGSPIVSLVGSTTTAMVSGEADPITEVSVRNLTGAHTYMGDLTFVLESPAGTGITLFDGSACASEDGIDVEFDDDAASVIGCADWLSGGEFRPIEALAAFDGENANGDWTLTVSDSFPQDEGQIDSWALEFCTPIDPGENQPPIAVDDSATTSKNTATTIDVLANDSDPENGPLTVVSATDPVNGSVVVNMDNTITYVPDQNYVGNDSFLYTIEDDEGATDTAAVSVTVTDDNAEADIDKTTGGGWLASDDGGKINFGFNAKNKDSGPQGNLQLNDKNAGVKIHLQDVTLVRAASDTCYQINSNGNSLEFHGTGKFNKNAASFRVCVEDNGEPGNSSSAAIPDRFFLECTSGCSYSTANRAANNELDGGNIQVQRSSATAGSASQPASGGQSGSAQASTVILDPVLLSEGTVGALQPFAIRVYGPQQEPLAGQPVGLTRYGADGSVESFSGVSNAAGTALLNVTLSGQPSEYSATAGAVDSNRVSVSPLLQ